MEVIYYERWSGGYYVEGQGIKYNAEDLDDAVHGFIKDYEKEKENDKK